MRIDLNALSYGQCKAILAADHLFDAIRALNDADGTYSSGSPDAPFGAAEEALKITLVEAFGEKIATKLYLDVIDTYDYPSNLLKINSY